MTSYLGQKLKSACDKIGGEFESSEKGVTNTCKIKRGDPEEGGVKHSISLNKHHDGRYAAMSKTDTRGGGSTGIISGEAEDIQISYGRHGLHSAEIKIQNTEEGGQVNIINSGKMKPYPEKDWGV